MIIESGTGNGKKWKINNSNLAEVHGITETEEQHATEGGDAYNINTGYIGSITTDATLLYIKNNETQDLVINAFALGIDSGGTHSNKPYLTLVRNPTGGDLISDATAVSMNQNRNFGSSETLTVDAYKGKVSGTLTGGNDIAILQATPDGRSFYTINLIIPKGSSIGIKYTANLSSGTEQIYCAAIVHLKDASLADVNV